MKFLEGVFKCSSVLVEYMRKVCDHNVCRRCIHKFQKQIQSSRRKL